MDVAARAQALFGDALADAPGVLHVTALWAAPASEPSEWLTIRIGPDAPPSETDGFSLSLARARCDAIVTTARILREEPDVEHRLAPEITEWRRQVRRLEAPPVSVILTGRPDLDLDHPLVARGARVLVVTTRDAAAALAPRARAAGSRVEVVGRDAPSIRDTVRFLQTEAGLPSVCIEAGPSSSLALYEDPPLVDELVLSLFEGAELPAPARGGAFRSRSGLELDFAPLHRARVQEPSGPWSFVRLVRRSG